MCKRRSRYGDKDTTGLRAWLASLAILAACGYPPLPAVCGGENCHPGQECAVNQDVCIDIGGCGDGVVDRNKGEVCDDGNIVDGSMDTNGIFRPDTCNHDCTSTQECGNGIKDIGETCDEGKNNGLADSSCNINCQIISSICGNGIIELNIGEQCDPGLTDSFNCNSHAAGPGLGCRFSRCGDGYVNMTAEEQCDNASNNSDILPDACRTDCRRAFCGDGVKDSDEECDDGANNNNTKFNACRTNCRKPFCGDGVKDSGELCDPGGSYGNGSVGCSVGKVCDTSCAVCLVN